MTDIAKRDQLIEQLQCEINHKKEKINKQFRELKNLSKGNKYLENVAEDYQKYFKYMKSEKESQQKQLEMILDYLDRLVLEEKLSTEALKHAKSEQLRAMSEINNIKGEIDQIMSLPNIYE